MTPTIGRLDPSPPPPPTWERDRRRHVAGAVATVVAVLLVATAAGFWFSPIGDRWRADAASQPPQMGVTTIDLVDSNFRPASIAVPVGAEVTWRWTDGEEHNVVFDDGTSSAVQAAGTWSRGFDRPGEYAFTCTLHAFMDGRVVVTNS